MLKLITERDATATVVSIDGVGAFDHVSRGAMLGNLMQLTRACSALPFVCLFYGQPSVYLWSDMHGNTHEIHQGEEGVEGRG